MRSRATPALPAASLRLLFISLLVNRSGPSHLPSLSQFLQRLADHDRLVVGRVPGAVEQDQRAPGGECQ
jgi:hypothetical protein